MSWRFLTSGESHGRGLLVIVEGLPSGLSVSGRISPPFSKGAAGDSEGEHGRMRSVTSSPCGEGSGTGGRPVRRSASQLATRNGSRGMGR